MPAARKLGVDVYVNRVIDTLTMSGANAITFGQIRFGMGVFAGVAIVVHRVEFHFPAATIDELIAAADWVQVGLVNRDDLAVVDPTSLNVLVVAGIQTVVVGAVVGINHLLTPLTVDLTGTPGGGLIVPSNPLYLCLDTSGFVSAAVVHMVLYYTFKTLTDKDYIELVQGMLPANI